MRETSAIVWDNDVLRLCDRVVVVDPGHGEIEVAVEATGICHSDLNVVDGLQRLPPPVVLGHEGAGSITRLGEGVEHLTVGQRVLLSSMTPCGRCAHCHEGHLSLCRESFGRSRSPFTIDGTPARAYASVGSFAAHTVVRADQAVPIPAAIAATEACLVGCAVTTAYGSVCHLGGVEAGARVGVFGIGGIGAAALQVSRLRRAGAVVAIDVDPGKGAVAERLGATEVILERDAGRVLDRLRDGGGLDVAIECSGAISAIETAISSLAPGGTAVLVGIPPPGSTAAFDVGAMFHGRRIVGAFNGAIRPHVDIPTIFDHAVQGELDLAALVGSVSPLTTYEAAIERVRAGEVVRAVLVHG